MILCVLTSEAGFMMLKQEKDALEDIVNDIIECSAISYLISTI